MMQTVNARAISFFSNRHLYYAEERGSNIALASAGTTRPADRSSRLPPTITLPKLPHPRPTKLPNFLAPRHHPTIILTWKIGRGPIPTTTNCAATVRERSSPSGTPRAQPPKTHPCAHPAEDTGTQLVNSNKCHSAHDRPIPSQQSTLLLSLDAATLSTPHQQAHSVPCSQKIFLRFLATRI
jgi:hypothetical protein